MVLLVIDTNKVIAALLRDGTVRRVLYYLYATGIEVIAPREVVDEVLEHVDELSKRAGKTREDTLSILEKYILPKIKLYELSEYIDYLNSAVKVCEKFDIEDEPFIALAMKYNCFIWSNDDDLREKQEAVKVLTTREIINIIEKIDPSTLF